jgi:hypothetical protein
MKRLACIPLILAACSSAPVYEDKYAYEEGWRLGKVTHVGPASTIVERASKDCRPGARAEGNGDRTFARVSVHWGHFYRSFIGLVPKGEQMSVGDDVYVDYQDCGHEIAPRHEARSR